MTHIQVMEEKNAAIQGAAYVFERLSEATVRPELYFFDFQRFLA